MDIKITHDPKNHKFTAKVDESECYLHYNRPKKNIIDFYSTFVPGELRGKGIAAQLVETGLKFAEQNKLQVIPSCSYVDVYIHRNEKYLRLLYSNQTTE